MGKMSNYPTANELTDADKILVSREGVTENISPEVLAEEVKKRINAMSKLAQYYGSSYPDSADIKLDGSMMVSVNQNSNPGLYAIFGAGSAYIFQFFYNTVTEESNRFQIAHSYLTNQMATRFYHTQNNGWSEWMPLLTPDMVSNENLADNANFKINQKGKKQYTSSSNISEICVDRWIFFGTLQNQSIGLLDIYDDYIRIRSYASIKNTKSDTILIQHIFKINTNRKITVTINVLAITGEFTLFENGTGILDKVINTQGIHVFHFTPTRASERGYLDLQFANLSGSAPATIDIAWIKVEEGSVATAYTPPDPILEMVKCKNYFERFYPRICQIETYEPISKCVTLSIKDASGRTGTVTYNGILNSGPSKNGFSLVKKRMNNWVWDMIEISSFEVYCNSNHIYAYAFLKNEVPDNILDYVLICNGNACFDIAYTN